MCDKCRGLEACANCGCLICSNCAETCSRCGVKVCSDCIAEDGCYFCCDEEAPYCECVQIKLAKKIIKMRQEGKKLHQISHIFNDVYELFIYPGDLFKWLDTLVHNLRAVKRIANILKIIEMVDIVEMHINSIERPKTRNNKKNR